MEVPSGSKPQMPKNSFNDRPRLLPVDSLRPLLSSFGYLVLEEGIGVFWGLVQRLERSFVCKSCWQSTTLSSIYCTQHLSPLFRLTLEQTLFTLHEFYLKMRNTLHMHLIVQYQGRDCMLRQLHELQLSCKCGDGALGRSKLLTARGKFVKRAARR